MEFLVKPPDLIILKYLSINNNKAETPKLKRDLVGKVKEINNILDSLWLKGYIEISTDMIVSLSQAAIDYLSEYDNFGSEYIFEDKLDLAILKFLYEIDTPISTKWFPKIIQDSSPTYTMNSPEGMDLDTYIVYHSNIKSYVINQNDNFSLKPTGRSYYESILATHEKAANKENFEIQNKQLQSQISELTFESLQYHKENRDLVEKLSASQIKINELSLIKKPNWKERNWLWIALATLIIGFISDIGKEVVKHRIYPEQKEIKTRIQEKKDSVALLQ